MVRKQYDNNGFNAVEVKQIIKQINGGESVLVDMIQVIDEIEVQREAGFIMDPNPFEFTDEERAELEPIQPEAEPAAE